MPRNYDNGSVQYHDPNQHNIKNYVNPYQVNDKK